MYEKSDADQTREKKLRFRTSDGAVSVVFRKGVKSPAVSPDFSDNTI